MVKIQLFLSRPSSFRDREHYDLRKVRLVDMNEIENGKLFIFRCGGYESEIYIVRGGFVKFYCGCESFRYEFSSLLNRRGSLLRPEEFSHLGRLPRKRAVTYICKHLEACLKKYRTLILKEV